MTKVFTYANCSSCKQALKFLDSKNIRYEQVPIVETPPTAVELTRMLLYLRQKGDDLKNLFNTSGVPYRELGLSEKLKAGLPDGDAIQLLSTNGKLIKRPFLLTANSGAVGFKPDEWTKLLE